MSDDGGISISRGVRIRRHDDHNVVIERFRERETKPGVWDVVGYYPSVVVAARALAGHHFYLVMKEQGDIGDLIRALEDFSASLEKTLVRAAT